MKYLMRFDKMLTGLNDLINCIKSEVKTMIEIGSYAGESTLLFSEGFDCKINCVDSWQNGYDNNDVASDSDMNEVENDFDLRMSGKNVIKYKMKSDDAHKFFSDNSYDLIYVDGCHIYEQVKRDLINYMPKVKTGGFICGHDYPFPDVKRALKDLQLKPDKIFQDGSFLIRKTWI